MEDGGSRRGPPPGRGRQAAWVSCGHGSVSSLRWEGPKLRTSSIGLDAQKKIQCLCIHFSITRNEFCVPLKQDIHLLSMPNNPPRKVGSCQPPPAWPEDSPDLGAGSRVSRSLLWAPGPSAFPGMRRGSAWRLCPPLRCERPGCFAPAPCPGLCPFHLWVTPKSSDSGEGLALWWAGVFSWS